MSDDTGLAQRVADLEKRILHLEDRTAVLELVFRWGPAVDTGLSSEAGSLWAEDGVLESDLSHLEGPAAVTAMVESEGQQSLIRRGSAHVQSAPIVTVDGDRAVVTTYSQVYLHAESGHDVWRVSANRWECRRTDQGWRLTRRVNRVIDGSPSPHEILARAFDPADPRP